MNNEKMLPNRCHEWIQGLKSPVFTDFFEPMKSFPLDGAGGFGGYIVNYAVYVFYLVCDTI